MINLTEYWHDRESRYRLECTGQIRENAAKTVEAVNKLLAYAEIDGIIRDEVSSGWRPKSINDQTANAAKTSKHLTAEACDIEDAGRELAQWCLLNLDKLDICGLWIEDPRFTYSDNGKHWVHFQTVAPKSGKRVFIPNNNPPKGSALVGQKPIPTRLKI